MSPIYYYFSLGNNFEEDLKINNVELKTYEKFISNYWKVMDLDRETFEEFKNELYFDLGHLDKFLNIEIICPFIKVLSKSKNFDKYNVTIELNDDNLNNDLIDLFNNLNNNNLIYPQIRLEFKSNNKNNFKSYNINFAKIKILRIINLTEINIYKDIFSEFNNYNNITYIH